MDNKKFFLEFGIRIILIYSIFFFAYKIFESTDLFNFLGIIEANIIFFFLELFYHSALLENNVITNIVLGDGNNVSLAIELICLGIIPIITYLTLMLALPRIGINKKTKSMIKGICIIFIANIARIILVIGIGITFGGNLFDFYHLVVLKYDLMLLVILLFLFDFIKLMRGVEQIKICVSPIYP